MRNFFLNNDLISQNYEKPQNNDKPSQNNDLISQNNDRNVLRFVK